MFNKIISVGATCQPAKRIREITNQTEAYFFDWLITPYPALIKVLKDDFNGILKPENLTYSDNRKIRLADKANGLEYQHDFSTDSNNPDEQLRTQILPGFSTECQKVQEKYERRTKRFKDALNNEDKILLVRYCQSSGELSIDSRMHLVQTIKSCFPNGCIEVLWASMLINEFSRDSLGLMTHLPK